MKIFGGILAMIGILFSLVIILYGAWHFSKSFNYNLSYKEMVKETVKEMVKESSLK